MQASFKKKDSGPHVKGLLQLLAAASLEVLRLLQLLLQLVQEVVLLLQVGEQLAPASPNLLQHRTKRKGPSKSSGSQPGCPEPPLVPDMHIGVRTPGDR